LPVARRALTGVYSGLREPVQQRSLGFDVAEWVALVGRAGMKNLL
jgi:hypothetical protein